MSLRWKAKTDGPSVLMFPFHGHPSVPFVLAFPVSKTDVLDTDGSETDAPETDVPETEGAETEEGRDGCPRR